jgi:hypothetical protein
MTDFKVQIWQPIELHSFYCKNEDIVLLNCVYGTTFYFCTTFHTVKYPPAPPPTQSLDPGYATGNSGCFFKPSYVVNADSQWRSDVQVLL